MKYKTGSVILALRGVLTEAASQLSLSRVFITGSAILSDFWCVILCTISFYVDSLLALK